MNFFFKFEKKGGGLQDHSAHSVIIIDRVKTEMNKHEKIVKDCYFLLLLKYFILMAFPSSFAFSPQRIIFSC